MHITEVVGQRVLSFARSGLLILVQRLWRQAESLSHLSFFWASLLLSVCFFLFLSAGLETAHAGLGNYFPPEREDIDLQSALQKMQMARSRSGYSFETMEKCLFPYIITICDNWKNMPILMRQGVNGMFQRPDNPESWWYKEGLPLTFGTPHFLFHYTMTGPDAVLSEDAFPLNGIPDLVDICADSFEKSYQVEISNLGYRTPYDDFWSKENGGDERYDVYLFSGPWLGFTMPEYPLVAAQSTVVAMPFYFGINSRTYEFVGASEGRRYVETTCAHEFFHAVQFAYNLYMPRWFMEASCTWIERIVYDGSEQGETDGNNYYNNLLTYWFRYPDWSLTKFNGWHEYGSVIWDIFLTEKYDMDIVKDIYEDAAEGTYRELANFHDPLASRGTNLGSAFKEFTVWNYFTGPRYDKRFYSRGAEYPPVSVHLDNIHSQYPIKVDLDSEESPENLGARYIRFLPSGEQGTFSIKVDGSDVTDSDDLQYLDLWGIRGWGAKLIIYQKGRSPRIEEIFPFRTSQEGQRNFANFGAEIEEIVLILSNLHPDLDIGSVSYSAGYPPEGKLSEPKLARNDQGEIIVSWELLDISDIKEVAIVRKRFAPSEGDYDDSDIQLSEVYSAPDTDSDGISDGNVNIVGKVPATDTVFVDKTVFTDVNPNRAGFSPNSVKYYYAVVPVNEHGIMGTPAIAKGGITPIVKGPIIIVTPQSLGAGESICYPNPFRPKIHQKLKFRQPGSRIRIFNIVGELIKELSNGESEWDGTNEENQPISSGIYLYTIEGDNRPERKGKILVIR